MRPTNNNRNLKTEKTLYTKIKIMTWPSDDTNAKSQNSKAQSQTSQNHQFPVLYSITQIRYSFFFFLAVESLVHLCWFHKR